MSARLIARTPKFTLLESAAAAYAGAMVSQEQYLAGAAAQTRAVTTLSVAVAGLLLGLKAWVWISSGSVALLASAADSGLDLVAALTTFFAVRYAAAPPDAEHRFGHGKAEAFASLVQAGLVFASCALIAQEAVVHLLRPQTVGPQGWALAVMLVSVVLTGGLIAAQSRVLRQVASVAVSADRTHYLADLASNLVALAGIAAAAWLGLGQLDALAGLALAALLLWGAVAVLRQAADQLLDHELPQDSRARIATMILQDPQITNVHQLRTRAAGPVIYIQAHADLDPSLSLEAAHHLLDAAEDRVRLAFPHADIMIHADPRGMAEAHEEIPESRAKTR